MENKEIIDILPDRKVDTIKEYLQSRDTSKVQIVVMDLSKSFKQAVQKALGNPLIIADRFHYMRQVYWALDEVRREVQRDLDKKPRIQMKRSKKLLWKSVYKLDEEESEKVQKLLDIDPRLQKAYALKNKLDQWFKESDKDTAKAGLEAATVSVTGGITFIGLMAPHIAKRLVGPRHQLFLPITILIGAWLLLIADTIGRNALQPESIPTGIVVAIIGAPYFIYLLLRSK